MTCKCLSLKAELGNLDKAIDFVSSCAEAVGIDAGRQVGLSVALEEAFVNVCNYAYPDAEGDIELFCNVAGDDFILEISDNGVPFDLLSLAEPDTSASIEDREIGGLGIFLLRKFTDNVSYRRENGRNKLTLLLHCSKDLP
jgi:anti-sigma regulatory factor (Ser/Thr protein kinase)